MGNVVSSVLSIGFEAAKNLLFEKAKYILELEAHLEALEEVKPDLEDAKVALKGKLEMNFRNGLGRDERCKDWISKVEAIQPKVTKLLEDSTAEIERLSMCGYCSSNFFLTYWYGRDVLETLKEVQSLLSSKPSGEVASTGPPPGIEERATEPTVGLEKMLETTWSHLMEKDVGILGLYGMGGVGKSTLLEKINEKLVEKKDEFEVVIFVLVSRDLQVEKIQNEIGERLGICDEEWKKKTQEKKSTSRINDVLAKRRFVMLLDDIWEKVKLKDIGIPFPSQANGSKVVFTTRSKVVCGRMRSHHVLEVKKLDEENAWELFRRNFRGNNTLSDPEILKLARQLCEKCGGLPLALNVIGETMAYKTSVPEWQCAIDDLDSNAGGFPEVEDEILKILKFSYDDLKDERVKQCFQYCALFPQDAGIDKDVLVEYWISEGIIDEGGDRKRTINEGHKIIGDLVRACLLMTVDTSEKVKMHDVLRQMALWVASSFGEKEENFIVKTCAGLKDMPKVTDWKAVRRMSLGRNEIRDISISPDCPNLTTLLLTRSGTLANISGDFFLSMPKLVILDLSTNINLAKLPEEVSKLVSLRHLDLSRTCLENLPEGLGKLTQLRYFALRGVRTRPSLSVISSLVNIEMLLLHDTTFVNMELLENIKLMENLKGLGISINDVVVLKRLLSIPRLASCIQHITLERVISKDGPLQFETAMASLRSIEIQGGTISDIMEHTRYGGRSTSAISFQNLSVVKISRVNGMQDLSWLVFAPNVISIHVMWSSRELQEIISIEKVSGILNEGSSIVPFRKLREIQLRFFMELKSIYWERLELPSLERVFIMMCPKLKKLPFSKERAYYFDLRAHNEEWFERLEWEDEAIED
ncbi:hypothetical protein IGI04_032594 [Brassica rapa subsp. trilocularis]|uniref:NB-ARC domain-containing protein n=1 Tax=Brassica rapa subsp. trilocularis TaxID=1813537 RepID=A0ABQ7LWW6_BRACM|nr:hypothetical protein IGI04_032594 [Brassica rapa subsp. trilocularis]